MQTLLPIQASAHAAELDLITILVHSLMFALFIGWGGVFVYTLTQLKIHVVVTKGFLRSLSRLDLPPSPVGALAEGDEPRELGT